MTKKIVKRPYICGPLTELPPEKQGPTKEFYVRVAELCYYVLGVRGFVPHEHYDPVAHANFTPQDVDKAERRQVCKRTSVLIVVPLAPSWGGGIEVEMARQSNVPALVLCEKEKLERRLISRLLRGNPAVVGVISYEGELNMAWQLAHALDQLFPHRAKKTA
ncbi:MAG: hypothetical protein PHD72_00210 [Patescibacteria group bacterium]|nr:hypothetical protein [Patescibacteria group bacterium]